ncbi:MAG: 4,5-DOPA dioxygenase extradiol [Saprospiraceae bacterium]
MTRKDFIKNSLILSTLPMAGFGLNSLKKLSESLEEQDILMPVLFIGHGAPLYALDDNKYSMAWLKIGQTIPKPKAVVSVSAHWLTPGKTLVTAAPKPKTIHDFGRIDDRLFEMQYPALGDPELAKEISTQVTAVPIHLDHDWGYDHGTWCVLHHMFPNADIPVIQLSIDYAKDGQYHLALAKELQFLRKKGVLIMGSGNIVHNLSQLKFPENSTYDWAIEFDQTAKNLIDKRDFGSLANYQKLGKEAQLSIPTPDHYFPLLYTLGLANEKESISYPIDGISYGSTSMRSVLIS